MSNRGYDIWSLTQTHFQLVSPPYCSNCFRKILIWIVPLGAYGSLGEVQYRTMFLGFGTCEPTCARPMFFYVEGVQMIHTMNIRTIKYLKATGQEARFPSLSICFSTRAGSWCVLARLLVILLFRTRNNDRQYWVLRRKTLIVRKLVYMRLIWFKSNRGRVVQLLWQS
jgi:hypothetical protein